MGPDPETGTARPPSGRQENCTAGPQDVPYDVRAGHRVALINTTLDCCACFQTVDNEEGLGQVLQDMGVESGQNISFENFWKLINKQAIQVFGSMHKEKNIKCTCQLQ